MSEDKKDLGHTILNEIQGTEPAEEKQKKPFLGKAAIPLLAILTGLIIGAILIAVTSQTVWAAFEDSFWKGLSQAWTEVITAYKALFTGSLGDPDELLKQLRGGDAKRFAVINPIPKVSFKRLPIFFAGLDSCTGLSIRTVQHWC